MRFGIGYDIHQLAQNRPLIIGGVRIDFELGLLGHSDADVLVHAIIDALLGSLALGDIGTHFPDNDDKFKNIDSLKLLKEVAILIEKQGYKINNIDSNIIAQKPKMAPHIEQMRKNIASVLNLEQNQISIKAKTNEHQDSVGNLMSIVSNAVVSVVKK